MTNTKPSKVLDLLSNKKVTILQIAIMLTLLLLISGDVHSNPGPDTNHTKKYIEICHVNVRSLKPDQRSVKLDELYSTALEKNFDVICVNETFLDETISDKDIELPGFQVFRNDRNRHGGGVAMYVHDSIAVKLVDDINTDDAELVCVEVRHREKSFLIVAWYRPPGSREDADMFLDQFQNIYNQILTKTFDSLFILGDFNDRCIAWEDSHCGSELGKRFFRFLEENLLFQVIKEPTYLADNYASLLDLIITDSPGFVMNSGVGSPIGDPSHCYVYCKIEYQYIKDVKYNREIWKYNNANFTELVKVLKDCPWQVMEVFDDIDDSAEYFVELYISTCKQYIPNKTITIHPRDKPWMNSAIKAILNERDKWHRKWKKSKSEYHRLIYNLKRGEANIAMMESKSNYYEKIKNKLCDSKTGSKQYWHLIKSLYGSKIEAGIPSIIDGDKIISTAREKSELFNKHFLKKSTLPDDLPRLPPLEIPEFSLDLIQTNEDEVKKIIRGLNVNKASGYDNVSNKLIKSTSDAIAKPFADLINKTLTAGKFPRIWKKANVPPVFKQNDRQNKNNYRPISLLSNIGKLCERIVFKHMYAFCLEHNLLTWKNSGYKPLDSSTNQLIYISHKIYKSLENGNDVCFVSLDASAAFDRVWHDGLLYKLQSKGITGKLLQWLESYLKNRQQRVVIKGQYSEWSRVAAGVPQGSILGPLLFLIYIDDIVNDIEANIFLFADDTSILEAITDPKITFERINRDLSKLSVWSEQWLVNFNPTKTKYIIFSKRTENRQYPSLYIGDTEIKRVKQHKQLGLLFSEDMTFEAHINENCQKAMNRLTALKRLGSKIPRKSRLSIYISFIRPVLEFGFQLYDNSPKDQLDQIENVQRQAALFITGAYKKTSHAKLLKELGLTTLAHRRQQQKIQFIYKATNNLLPQYIEELIPTRVGLRADYNLRNPDSIPIPKTTKNYFLKSYIPSSIKAWNDTTADIRRSKSTEALKAKLAKLYGSKLYPLYLLGDGPGGINHSRLRMGLSGLNAHRKKYHFIQEATCQYCNFKHEDPVHYLLHCPAFAVHRQQMLQDLASDVPDTVGAFLNYSVQPRLAGGFATLMLNGTGDRKIDELLFTHVQNYISKTQRF